MKIENFFCVLLLSLLMVGGNTSAYAYEADMSSLQVPVVPEVEEVPDSVDLSEAPNEVYLPDNVVIKKKNKIGLAEWIVPTGLIAFGTVATYGDWFKPVNHGIRDGMARLREDRYLHFDDYIQYVPAAMYLSLGAMGVKCKHSFKERAVVGLTAYACTGILGLGGKYTFRIMRPDNSRRNSFPSGHSAFVFTGAELMREEYGLGLGLASYGIAAIVGVMRMYNNRHWLTDVIAGAGVGVLSARIGYWMLPVYQKWFGWDKSDDAPVMVATPGYDADARALTFNFAMTF